MTNVREGMDARELAAWLEEAIKRFFSESPENSLKNAEGEKAFDAPLVGFSRGDDSIYAKLKEDIGPFYLTPVEIFEKSFPDEGPVSGGELTVVSWILPQTRNTRAEHRKETVRPSERWARARYYGEMFNDLVRKHVSQILENKGIAAVAPLHAPFWSWAVSERYSLASNWSERHAAFVAGLGTFGLCDGLITPVGKAIRCGSVVARMAVPPTQRPYNNHREYCLHFSKGTCDKCIKRCPAGAISTDGHDKIKCQAYLKEMSGYIKERFGFETHPCGLCQTGVPCEFRIPASKS